ncbi:hypothetical protein NKDENANG_03196 [Candidatus Entotheonellaceae bacterium PAL068K]
MEVERDHERFRAHDVTHLLGYLTLNVGVRLAAPRAMPVEHDGITILHILKAFEDT